MKNKIIIGSDHAGYQLKNLLIEYIKDRKWEITDVGCYSEDSCDYPDYAQKVVKEMNMNDDALGIVICGSGNGMSIAMNRHKGIRCALCWNPELAYFARSHNNANVMSLPARFIDVQTAIQCVEKFISTPFEGGRHERRIQKIDNI